jgi:CxxC-x17-CxxC domain-containing protein
MGNFNKGGKFGGHGFGGGDEGRPGLHKATCTDCGKPCEVPFKPMPGKSVFCSDCFKKEGNAGAKKFEGKGFEKFGKKDFGKGGFEDRQMFEAVCADCGKVCKVPFRPNGEKPVFCRDCFGMKKEGGFGAGKPAPFMGNKGSSGPRTPDRTSEQLEKMNAKLERMLKLLEALGQKREPAKEFAKKEEVAKPVVKKEVVAEKPKKAAKAAKPKKAKKAK